MTTTTIVTCALGCKSRTLKKKRQFEKPKIEVLDKRLKRTKWGLSKTVEIQKHWKQVKIVEKSKYIYICFLLNKRNRRQITTVASLADVALSNRDQIFQHCFSGSGLGKWIHNYSKDFFVTWWHFGKCLKMMVASWPFTILLALSLFSVITMRILARIVVILHGLMVIYLENQLHLRLVFWETISNTHQYAPWMALQGYVKVIINCYLIFCLGTTNIH